MWATLYWRQCCSIIPSDSSNIFRQNGNLFFLILTPVKNTCKIKHNCSCKYKKRIFLNPCLFSLLFIDNSINNDVKYIWNNSFLNCGCRWKWRIILDQTTSKSPRAVCSTALYTWWKNRCSLKKYKPRNDGVSRIYGHTLAKQIQFFFLEKLTLSWLSRASDAGANHGSEFFFWNMLFFRLLFPENVWVSS